jgi:single-strand DNA-binding protein
MRAVPRKVLKMSGEILVTITGNLTADPELRFTPSGDAVVNLQVASSPRKYDSKKDKWVDGDPFYMRVSAWRQMAENIAESLYKGDRVIVTGVLQQRQYEKDGEKRTVVEMTANDVAASMLFATVKSNRAVRGSDDTSDEESRDSESEPQTRRAQRPNTRERATSRR